MRTAGLATSEDELTPRCAGHFGATFEAEEGHFPGLAQTSWLDTHLSCRVFFAVFTSVIDLFFFAIIFILRLNKCLRLSPLSVVSVAVFILIVIFTSSLWRPYLPHTV
jgi:hypothetical protein